VKPKPEVDDEVLEEGCYHLEKLGLPFARIATHFEITEAKARSLAGAYAAKLKGGEATEGEFDRTFWSDVMKEAEGDMKLTVVSEKGFHHAWKSELAKLDGPALMAIYEASKDFLNADPNQRFLDYPPPKGFDPLAMEREVKKSVEVVSSLLQQKWEKGSR
jgi:hypothetical protein